MNRDEDAALPAGVHEARRRYGSSVWYGIRSNGECWLGDGMGARGTGETWESALEALELDRDRLMGLAAQAYAREEERFARMNDALLAWTVRLALAIVSAYVAFALYRISQK